MNELEPRSEYMHNPGEHFVDSVNASEESTRNYVSGLHTLAKVELGETPGGSECEDYTAICGHLAFSWTSNEPTKFGQLEQIIGLADFACSGCFNEERLLEIESSSVAEKIRTIQVSQVNNKDLPDYIRTQQSSL